MITVTFLNGCILATAEQSLWQYSYNQQLQINGLELPGVFTVDFCNEGDTTTVAMIGSSGVVDIPNELLTSGRDIVAYVFQKSALTGGVTRCEIRIDVLTRPERDDETPTPEQEAVIDQYIAELNEGVEKANESAEDAEAWAVGERGGEPVSESDPTYENNAKYWAENISGQLEDYRTAADQDAIDSAQDGKINALTNLLNKKQSKITANGILKGDGNGGISAAVPGMDYLPTSALYAYRSAIKQDEIDNAQNANIAKNADDIADVKTTADTALQPAALAPYRTAADQNTIDNAQAADIAAINDKIPSTASKNNKLVAWSTFNGQLGTKQAKITANGILKGDGAGGVSAAVAGTDYLAPPALDAYRTAAAQDEIDAAQDEDIADVKAAVDQKAPIIINSASGDIAHFEDGADNMPVKQLSVNVEPIQDLHGYDSPWPAGGGKNKLNSGFCLNRTSRGLRTVVNADGSITLTGTAETATRYWNSADNLGLTLAAGTYTLSPSNLRLEKSGGSVYDTFTLSEETTFSNVYWGGFTSGEVVNTIVYPQLEIGSTATAYAPYENICPISGRTSATVTRTGVNIWDEEWEVGGINSSTGQNNNETNLIRSKNYIPVKPGMAIWVQSPDQGTTPGNLRSRYYDINKQYLGMNPTMNVRTSTEIPDNCYFVRFACQPYYGTSYNNDISINYPSTDHNYHPYQGNTYTIQLGDTVYGGTLDVTAGKMVADRAIVDLGTLSWAYSGESSNHRFSAAMPSDYKQPTSAADRADMICSAYASNPNVVAVNNALGVSGYQGTNLVFIRDLAYTDSETFNAAVSGVQLVYELATPFEITLSPTQIETLLGQNNIWSDAGAVDVDYPADTKLYIQNIHQPTEDDMTADAQIASGKYFLVNGNLYKSTTVIPAGDTIIPGTNCIKTNLAEALNALNA